MKLFNNKKTEFKKYNTTLNLEILNKALVFQKKKKKVQYNEVPLHTYAWPHSSMIQDVNYYILQIFNYIFFLFTFFFFAHFVFEMGISYGWPGASM